MSRVNIIIRTLNEGKWLDLCLRSLEGQEFQDFDVTLIDSGSNDLTLDIAKKHNIKPQVISEYRPGAAINMGIESKPHAQYAIVLSAHCVPISKTWLSHFVSFMEIHSSVPAAYGKQVPMNFTNFDNARDLAFTFRGSSRVTDEGFLHNANSVLRIGLTGLKPFNEETKHIEDLLWASDAHSNGTKIGYCAEAAVTHFHGLHQHSAYESVRARGLVDVLRTSQLTGSVRLLDLFPRAALNVVPVNFSDQPPQRTQSTGMTKWDIPGYRRDLPLSQVLEKLARFVCYEVPDAIAIALHDSPLDHSKFDELVGQFFEYYPDAVIPAVRDHGNYWLEEASGFQPVQHSLVAGQEKKNIWKEKLFGGSVIQLNSLALGDGVIKDSLLFRTEG